MVFIKLENTIAKIKTWLDRFNSRVDMMEDMTEEEEGLYEYQIKWTSEQRKSLEANRHSVMIRGLIHQEGINNPACVHTK